MIPEETIRQFSVNYYSEKDEMHGLEHITRILALAREIAVSEQVTFNENVLVLGAYFHGFVYTDEEACRSFLSAQSCSSDVSNSAIAAAWDSQKEVCASTVEGQLLHDAHLLEGGVTYIVTKSLVVGTRRGQTLGETIEYIEKNVIGKYSCHFPSCAEAYQRKEEFARDFLVRLRVGLDLHAV